MRAVWFRRLAELGLAFAINRPRIQTFINKAIDFESKQLRIQSWKGKFRSLGRMAKAVINGQYKFISPWLFVHTLVGIAYVLTNADLIPDKLYKLGLLDDFAVIIWVVQTYSKEIERFEMWEVDQQVQNIQLV